MELLRSDLSMILTVSNVRITCAEPSLLLIQIYLRDYWALVPEENFRLDMSFSGLVIGPSLISEKQQ